MQIDPDDYPEFDPIVLKCIHFMHIGDKASRRALKELYHECRNRDENKSTPHSSRGNSPNVIMQQKVSPIKGLMSPIKNKSPVKLEKSLLDTLNDKRKGAVLEKDQSSKKARIDHKDDLLPRYTQNKPDSQIGLSEQCEVCKQSATSAKDQLIECNECHMHFHQKCHIPRIPDSTMQERLADTRFVWKCEECNKEILKLTKESKKKTENSSKEEKNAFQPFKRADKVSNIKSTSSSREGSPSLSASWASLGSRSDKSEDKPEKKLKKEKKGLQSFDFLGSTDSDLAPTKKKKKEDKEVNPSAVKALKDKEKKKAREEEKSKKSARSREKDELEGNKKMANIKKRAAEKQKLKQAAKRV